MPRQELWTSGSAGRYVQVLYDGTGRQIIAGYSAADDAISVISSVSTLSQTLLSAVVAAGTSASVNAVSYDKATFQFIASAVTDGAAIKIQASLDDSNWVDLHEEGVVADGSTAFQVSNEKWAFYRSNITTRSDGIYSVKTFLGS